MHASTPPCAPDRVQEGMQRALNGRLTLACQLISLQRLHAPLAGNGCAARKPHRPARSCHRNNSARACDALEHPQRCPSGKRHETRVPRTDVPPYPGSGGSGPPVVRPGFCGAWPWPVSQSRIWLSSCRLDAIAVLPKPGSQAQMITRWRRASIRPCRQLEHFATNLNADPTRSADAQGLNLPDRSVPQDTLRSGQPGASLSF